MSTSLIDLQIQKIQDDILFLKQLVTNKKHHSREVDRAKQVIANKLRRYRLDPSLITVETLKSEGFLETEAIEIYDYLKNLELI
ncbi:MAG: hypothetical protein GPJ51_11075 [Candidatus Heimdallarchaeota archaeon]|nr:hypothetical protein [Candidatus Heimdallarchaeota archaeon]